jgi:translation initiation factor 1 (eIF-1/SUI1)
MGQFKPMIKMETTEPSVELKLKKGGHVSMKKKSEHGHKSMEHHFDGGIAGAIVPRGVTPAMTGVAPKKPAMAMRRRAMSAMPTSMPTPVMKKGGEMESPKEHKAEMKKMGKIEKELKHHESMKAGKAHKGLKAGGEASAKKMDKFETMTTIEGNEKPYEKTKMHQAKKDKVHGTGAVREGNAGGYKKGGKVHHKATGGAIPSDTDKKADKGRIVMGGTIEGNERDYAKTQVHQAKRDTAHGTGGVKMSNAGGYKRGGKTRAYNVGGAIEGNEMEYAIGNVRGTPKGKTNTTTGEVKESNAGGYKKGGALKKHFATGGSVNRTGHAVVMPQANKPASRAVHINELSGTFKRGGKVHKHAEGGSSTEDLSKGAYDKTLQGVYNEDMDMAKYLRNIPSRIYQGVKNLTGMGEIKPAGSVTKSKESVTVTPAKKRGGSVKHC